MKKGELAARIILDLLVALEVILLMAMCGAIETDQRLLFWIILLFMTIVWGIMNYLFGGFLRDVNVDLNMIRLPFWKNGEENEIVQLPKFVIAIKKALIRLRILPDDE